MKKLIVIAVLTIGLSTFAQKPAKNPRKENLEQFTPQQRNELRLKTLTLDLGLNAAQQKEIGKIITEMEAKKEAFQKERLAKKEVGTKPTNDELFAMRIKLLDEKIATKERLKKILDVKQFEKWEQMQSKRMERNRKNAKKKMGRGSAEK
jgi:protein CpxP